MLEDWFPMSPFKGPPLPQFMNILWPWYNYPGAYYGYLLATPSSGVPEIGGVTVPLAGWKLNMYEFVDGLTVPWGYVGSPGYARKQGGETILKSSIVQKDGYFEIKSIPPGRYMFIGVTPWPQNPANPYLALGANMLPNSPVIIEDAPVNAGRRNWTTGSPDIIEWIKAHPEVMPA